MKSESIDAAQPTPSELQLKWRPFADLKQVAAAPPRTSNGDQKNVAALEPGKESR